jgi:uncharacterized membrane protein YeaQ/YmgE (transglycosylase-associated protein family)
MSFLGWIFAGLIVGALARFLMPGRQPMGILATMLLGIIGALVGGGISYLIWRGPHEPFSQYAWPGYIMAVVGAFLVLWLGLSMNRGRGGVPNA